MLLNTDELNGLQSSLLSQLQQASLCQASSTPIAVYIVPNSALVSDIEFDLFCIVTDLPYEILDAAQDAVEVGFFGAGAEILADQVSGLLVPDPRVIVYDVAKAVYASSESVQEQLFQLSGACWTFTDGTVLAMPPTFCPVGTIECNEHIRLLVPLASIPGSTLDLRNVLGNLLYGVIIGNCGGYPSTYLNSTACNTWSFTVSEVSYAAGGGGIDLPGFTAQIVDTLGNTISACSVPSGPPDTVVTTFVSPAGAGTVSGGGGAYSGSVVTLGCVLKFMLHLHQLDRGRDCGQHIANLLVHGCRQP